MLAVLLNPRSRANRRDPRIASELQAIVGGEGRVYAPKTLEELDEVAAGFRRAPPEVIAVLGGGTMNVVASSLGIRQKPATFMASLTESARLHRPPDVIQRRCMRVGGQL